MIKRRPILLAGLVCLLGVFLISAGFGKQEKKSEPRSLYEPGRAVYPVPKPVAPPTGPYTSSSLMAALSLSQSYSASRVSSYSREGGPRDNFWIPATGEEITLADLRGPGAVTHIWMTFRGKGRDLILRIYWDGSAHPSVEAPIGDFFGVAMGIDANVTSLPIQISSEGRSRNCWWHMPFNKSARVTVSAAPGEQNTKKDTIPLYFYIDYQVYARPIKDLNYFHARFLETDPARRGQPVMLAEAEGSGHFVGLVMGHRARTPGWFGEGDDIITVDGNVSFLGTGTEDYFCDAWGFRVFSDLYHGVPVMEGREVGSRLSAYRFHIMDAIPFRRSFKFEIEHWPWISPWPNSGRDYYSSVGFWYQKSIHKPWPRLEKLISAEPWDPAKGRWHIPGALEAEDLGILEYQSKLGENVRPEVQTAMPNLSGDQMLSFDSGGDGEFSLAVPIKEEGTYGLTMYLVRAPDFGIVDLSVNGKGIASGLDTFLRTDDLTRPVWPPKEFVIAGVQLKAGMNVIRFSIRAKNSESDGYKMGIDCLTIARENSRAPQGPDE